MIAFVAASVVVSDAGRIVPTEVVVDVDVGDEEKLKCLGRFLLCALSSDEVEVELYLHNG